ncbi:hypothetical protein CBL_21108, partial [Carabus blaptoides fortunei]
KLHRGKTNNSGSKEIAQEEEKSKVGKLLQQSKQKYVKQHYLETNKKNKQQNVSNNTPMGPDELLTPSMPPQHNPNSMLTCNFHQKELEMAIKMNANSSPGWDNIHYKMISQLSNDTKNILLNFFNHVFAAGTTPKDWEVQIISPILKTQKNPAEPSSYRPIALTSCIKKTFERLDKIQARMVDRV